MIHKDHPHNINYFKRAIKFSGYLGFLFNDREIIHLIMIQALNGTLYNY